MLSEWCRFLSLRIGNKDTENKHRRAFEAGIAFLGSNQGIKSGFMNIIEIFIFDVILVLIFFYVVNLKVKRN